jgi:hypothetical protein
MIFGFALHHPVRPANNDMVNNYGLTPLALACVLGKAKIFREIIEVSCQVFMRQLKSSDISIFFMRLKYIKFV